MSRSNPSVNAPKPAVRWFEWNGEHGTAQITQLQERRDRIQAEIDELTARGWKYTDLAAQREALIDDAEKLEIDILRHEEDLELLQPGIALDVFAAHALEQGVSAVVVTRSRRYANLRASVWQGREDQPLMLGDQLARLVALIEPTPTAPRERP